MNHGHRAFRECSVVSAGLSDRPLECQLQVFQVCQRQEKLFELEPRKE